MMRLAILVAVAAIAVLGVRAADAAGRPVTVVDDPQVLAKLDADGFGFADIFGISGKDDLKTLYDAAPAYHAIVDTVAADVAALRADLKAGGRPLYEVTDGNVGRIIDMRWLKTDAARFRQVGVVNRLDRRDFAKLGGEAGCGEVRFIYRLAYSFRKNGKVLASSCRSIAMPSTAQLPTPTAAVPASPGAGRRRSTKRRMPGGCPADRWIKRASPSSSSNSTLRWCAFLPARRPNLAVRPPIDGTTISQKPLENTPDTIRLAQDARLKARLTDYVRANAGAIDRRRLRNPG
ncbi:hypothetical protein [Mesorhizobium sp. WSM3868]|uniref:hypothetical protein n=1 Tax=Mesorhizobium sp. WSM3868 TaxID=2029405 RepID=UPI001FE0522C|nr:hypothetical protein [Mesorhizobium sp. WSM3868]